MEPIVAGPTPVISVSEGLELRPIVAEDVPALYALVESNRQRLREWLPWLSADYSQQEMHEYALSRELENRQRLSLTSVIRVDGAICGAISLHKIDPRHRNSSVGYWLAAGYEGRGIMTQACRAIVTEAFTNYELHRVEIRCAIGNGRSKGIPRRLGFTEEGVLRQAEWLYDHWVDLRVFSMLEQDWQR